MVYGVNALSRAYTISTTHEHYVLGGHGSVSMPSVGHIPFLQKYISATAIVHQVSVNALSRAYTISTLPPKKPFIYAGFKPHFCRYFSEYSENLVFRDQKVGKGEIVFFQVQFVILSDTYYMPFLLACIASKLIRIR